MRRIGIHGTKFKNAEQTLVAAHPFLAEKTGPLESSLTHAANTNSSGESTMVPASASKKSNTRFTTLLYIGCAP